MRIVFMGTPDFAVPSLKALIDEQMDVVGVFCQPDRPKGRGYKLTACPVKEVAVCSGIPVFQPERIKSPEGVAELRELAPDLCVTAAFGQILSEECLSIPKYGTVNVHASLLPRHRGSAPVHYSIMAGDAETGVTTMLTDAGMDTGDILMKASTKIGETDTAGTLTEKLSHLGAELLIETIAAIENGTLKRTKQDESRATYEPKLTHDTGCIKWEKTCSEIDRQVRGCNPWPAAFTMLQGERMKVLAVQKYKGMDSSEPGTVIKADAKSGFFVACGDGAIELITIQLPGQRQMTARDYLKGHALQTGTILGEEENERQ